MIPDSAFVTVGESAKTLERVAAGESPSAEYVALRAGHFSRTLAMVDRGIDAGSMVACGRFAAQAYRETWDARNIYLGEEFPGIQYLAVDALLRRPRRIVMLMHNVASRRRHLPLATLRLAGRADHIFCLSEASRQELVSRYGYPAARSTVVGARVDTAFFTPEPATATLGQVCSAGAVNRDYKLLMRAVEPLGVPLRIAADTAWRYTAGQQDVGPLPPFVEMRSWGTYTRLRSLYAESAVVVVPLARALLSGVTVALEGMAMGKPVILTRNPYVEDFLVHGEHGLFVDAGDTDGMTRAIRWVLEHPAEAERMGARAREWVLERFTVAQYVERILSVWH